MRGFFKSNLLFFLISTYNIYLWSFSCNHFYPNPNRTPPMQDGNVGRGASCHHPTSYTCPGRPTRNPTPISYHDSSSLYHFILSFLTGNYVARFVTKFSILENDRPLSCVYEAQFCVGSGLGTRILQVGLGFALKIVLIK